MRRIALLLTVSYACSLGVVSAWAQSPSIDRQYGEANTGFNAYLGWGQTFTPTANNIVAFDLATLYGRPGFCGGGTGTVMVFQWPAGPVVATIPGVLFPATPAPDTVHVAIPGGPRPLRPGKPYAIRVVSGSASSDAGCSVWGCLPAFGGCANYPGGGASFASSNPSPDVDLPFATYYDPTFADDVTPPETSVGNGPSDPTTSTSATFGFWGDDATTAPQELTFECSLDGAPFIPCTSPLSYEGLSVGDHVFQVRATDAEGHVDQTPATHAWTIEPLVCAPPASGMVGWWPGNGDARDVAGGNDGVLPDGLAFAPGEVGQAFAFDGANVVEVPDSPELSFGPTAPMSIDLWAFRTGQSTEMHLLGKRVGCGPSDPATINYQLSIRGFSGIVFGAGGESEVATFFPIGLPLNTWTHVAATFDGAEMRLYVDGNFIAANQGTLGTAHGAPLTIGGSGDCPGFEGRLDEVRIYNRTLSEAEIRAIFNAGTAGTCGNQPATPAITWPTPSDITYPTALGGAQLNATASVPGSFAYTPAAGTVLNAGPGQNLSVSFTPADTTNYTQASKTVQINVLRASQTITMTSQPAAAAFGTTFDATATASSGLPVSISAEGACSASGGTVTMTSGAGTCQLTFAQPGNGNYLAAPTVVGTTMAQPASQTIAFGALADRTYGDAPFPVVATASSGLPVTVSSDTAATCTVAAGTVTVAAAGSCTLRASQGGDADHAAAADVTQTFGIGRASQAIAFGPLPDRQFGEPDFTVSATGGGSGQPVTFTAEGSCSVAGSLVHIAGVGRCTLTAEQAGDASYAAAPPVPQSFNVADGVAPETRVDSGPIGPTSATSATFEFSGTDDVTAAGSLTFECRVDDQPFAACASPASHQSLSGGPHTFQVRAIDGAGNADPTPASFAWSIDATAPGTVIDSMPLDPTNQTTATFAFHSTEPNSTFECSLSPDDGGLFTPCQSGIEYTNLSDGFYTFQVRAVDQAGNADASPSSFTWTVDTSAPETAIDSAPADPTNSNSATFAFHASPGATFTCQLDGEPARACTSPVTYPGLAAGPHTFTVTAADPAGNADATPASFAWVVDLASPDTTITAGPAEGSTTGGTTATFEFTGADETTAAAGLTFECALDGAAFAPCATGVSYGGLSRAPHTFQVRAVDQAGNVDQSPAARTWTIAAAAPTITWANPPDITYPAPLGAGQLNATASIPGTFAYGPGAGTVLNAGTGQTLSVLFTPADSVSYGTASKTVQINVSKASQTIGVTQAPPSSARFNASFSVAAAASSGLPVAVTATGACSASGSTITMTSGTGTCSVTFSQAGNGNYLAATAVARTTTAQKAPQTITVTQAGPATAIYGTAFAVAATASSGLPVAIGASGACSIGGSTVTMTRGTGTCTVRFTQVGNENYLAAPAVTRTTAAQPAAQSITVVDGAPAAAAYQATFPVAATASSGLPVTISASGACSLAGGRVTMTSGTGTCTVRFTRPGDGNYQAAPPVVQSTAAQKLSQTIALTQAPPATALFNTTFAVAATASSGRSVAIAVSGACSRNGSTVRMTSGTGTCTVTFSEPGNANYLAAPPVVTATAAQKASQTITVTRAAPATARVGTVFPVAATASTGLPVTIGASGACAITGGGTTSASIRAAGVAGTCTVTFNQAGNANYASAPPVVQTTTVQ